MPGYPLGTFGWRQRFPWYTRKVYQTWWRLEFTTFCDPETSAKYPYVHCTLSPSLHIPQITHLCAQSAPATPTFPRIYTLQSLATVSSLFASTAGPASQPASLDLLVKRLKQKQR